MNDYEKVRFFVDFVHGMRSRGYDLDEIESFKVRDLADLSDGEIQRLNKEYNG